MANLFQNLLTKVINYSIEVRGGLLTRSTTQSSAGANEYITKGLADTLYASVGGGGTFTVVTKTANYTTVSGDDVILVDSTSGPITITLLTAVGVTKRVSIIMIAGSNNVTIATTGGQTINGSSSIVLNIVGTSRTFISNNSNYFIE